MMTRLLKKARRGDIDAFEQLITPYEQSIWRMSYVYTHTQDAASSCGVEAIMTTWRQLRNYREEIPFQKWIIVKVKQACGENTKEAGRTNGKREAV